MQSQLRDGAKVSKKIALIIVTLYSNSKNYQPYTSPRRVSDSLHYDEFPMILEIQQMQRKQ